LNRETIPPRTKALRHENAYDKSTDSLHVEVRPLPSCRTLAIEEDIMLDVGEDVRPVGYDIQHASTETGFFARLIHDELQAAAE